jgi:hypothetical protein
MTPYKNRAILMILLQIPMWLATSSALRATSQPLPRMPQNPTVEQARANYREMIEEVQSRSDRVRSAMMAWFAFYGVVGTFILVWPMPRRDRSRE